MDPEEIEDIELEIIQEWVAGKRDGTLPEEILIYLAQLESARVQILKLNNSKDQVLRALKLEFPELSDYHIRKRYADAINYFYVDKEVKLDAWGNYYAERLEKMSNLALELAETSRDVETAGKLLKDAAETRLKYRPVEHNLPEGIFTRPNKIYSTDVRILGREKVSRRDLAQLIDSYDIPEDEKKRLRIEASVDEPKLLLDAKERFSNNG